MVSNPALSFRPDPGTIPTDPGCYLWRDRHGRVVYVGKAKNLRARLSSYFQDVGNLHQRTRGMLEVAASVEWIIVASDVESLHLEYNLIKQHRPRFNVRYNDDKSYPYLAITLGEEVPRAMVRRNPRNDGSRYFGPFAHAYAIRDTLDMLLRVYRRPFYTESLAAQVRPRQLAAPAPAPATAMAAPASAAPIHAH